MINERFARYTRVSMFNLLRRSADVSVGGVQVTKFGEYIHSLYVATSLNMVKMKPLRGTALFILDARLVFKLVDNFLAATGVTPRSKAVNSPHRVARGAHGARPVLHRSQGSLGRHARLPVRVHELRGQPGPGQHRQPQRSGGVSTFNIELDGGGGELHVTMPYSMIEPIREMLDAGFQFGRGRPGRTLGQGLARGPARCARAPGRRRLSGANSNSAISSTCSPAT